MADEGTNTGLVVVIIVLVVALLVTVFYFTRGGAGGGQDAELELDVNTSGDSAKAGAVMVEPSLATEMPLGLRFVA